MKKILVVGNVRPVLDSAGGVLDRSTLKVLSAAANDDALNIHKSEKADIIIAPLDGAGMSGDSLCSMIRKDAAMKEVSIVLACLGRREELDKIGRCGANTYYVYNDGPDVLIEIILRLLSIRKRQSYRVVVHVKVEGKGETKLFVGQSQNVSATGILLETSAVLDKSDKVTCSFFLPGSKRIVAMGEVMRKAEKSAAVIEYGVRFLDITKEAKGFIDDFIKSRDG